MTISSAWRTLGMYCLYICVCTCVAAPFNFSLYYIRVKYHFKLKGNKPILVNIRVFVKKIIISHVPLF